MIAKTAQEQLQQQLSGCQAVCQCEVQQKCVNNRFGKKGRKKKTPVIIILAKR